MHFDYELVDGKMKEKKPTTYTLAAAIPCRNCGTVTDRIAEGIDHSIEASCKPECDGPIQQMERLGRLVND